MKPWLKAYTYTFHEHTEVRHPEKQLSTQLRLKSEMFFLRARRWESAKNKNCP